MTERLKLWSESIDEELDRQGAEHTVRFPFCEVVLWKNGVAAVWSEGWDRVTIQHRQWPNIELKLAHFPDRKGCQYYVVQILRLLHAAYEQGGKDRSRDFRLLLDAAQR